MGLAWESLAPSQIASKSSHARRSSKAHKDVSKVKATGADCPHKNQVVEVEETSTTVWLWDKIQEIT